MKGDFIMTRKALTPEQISRFSKCAPAIMEMLDRAERSFLELGYNHDAYITSKLADYIYYDEKLPSCFIPAENPDSPEQPISKEASMLTPKQKYADELFSALECCVKDCEAMAHHVGRKPEEWDNRYPKQKELIEKIKSQEVQSL